MLLQVRTTIYCKHRWLQQKLRTCHLSRYDHPRKPKQLQIESAFSVWLAYSSMPKKHVLIWYICLAGTYLRQVHSTKDTNDEESNLVTVALSKCCLGKALRPRDFAGRTADVASRLSRKYPRRTGRSQHTYQTIIDDYLQVHGRTMEWLWNNYQLGINYALWVDDDYLQGECYQYSTQKIEQPYHFLAWDDHGHWGWDPLFIEHAAVAQQLYKIYHNIFGGFHKWGYPNWMVFKGKSN